MTKVKTEYVTHAYIALQMQLVTNLLFLEEKNPAVLRRLYVECATTCMRSPEDWVEYLRSLDFLLPTLTPYQDWHSEVQFAVLISEQLHEESDGCISVLNLRGKPLLGNNEKVVDIHQKRRGSGNNRLRTPFCAQPMVLEEGDVLSTDERVISLPRAGAGGAILVYLSSEIGKVWRSFPPHVKLALKPRKAVASDAH